MAKAIAKKPKADPLGSFCRSFVFDRAQLNESDRTVPVVFSSEHPVDRGDYDEVLDHSKDGMDLSRLNQHHPLLLNHNPDNQIGVVEHAELDGGERKGRAVVRFGNSDLAKEIFQDVKDGIRKHMSVGYERLKAMHSTDEHDGGRRSIRFAWRPFELSIVPVPADPHAHVGRASALQQLLEHLVSNPEKLEQDHPQDHTDPDDEHRDTDGYDSDLQKNPPGHDGEHDGTVVDPDPNDRCQPDTAAFTDSTVCVDALVTSK